MPLAPPRCTASPSSASVNALMAWLDPPERKWAMNGVIQPAVTRGADVVRNLGLPAETAAAIAAEVDVWTSIGMMGRPVLPDGLAPDVASIVAQRIGSMRPPPRRSPPPGIGAPVGAKEGLSKGEGGAPQGVRDACRRGLELAPEHGGPGLTEGAKSRARSMASGQGISVDAAKRMVAWFARHDEGYSRESSPPSPGYVAFLLWGGAAGRAWAKKVAGSAEETSKSHHTREWHSGKYAGRRATEKAKGAKWRQKGWVGPGGARATADREAKKRGKPKAYADALYARFTGKA